jgi:ribosome biogenesis GTPase
MSASQLTLDQLGWRASYSSQLTLEDLDSGFVARVSAVHRGRVEALAEGGVVDIIVAGSRDPAAGAAPVAVGDWILAQAGTSRLLRVLERQSVIARMAAGEQQRVQPIAANVDTAFVVSSCNDDFNLSRLERYLAVVLDAGVTPVVVLTKADLCQDAATYVSRAEAIAPGTAVIALDATSAEVARSLVDWLGAGQTVVFIGSSGVGKSTLANSLTGQASQAVAGIRESDARGRHTTTSRQLVRMAGGAWLIDVPGMRELKIGAVDAGVRCAFDDLETLAGACRFRDCGHEQDEGCALRQAVAEGHLEPRRLVSFLKLRREAARAAQTLHERREAIRRVGRIRERIHRARQKERDGRGQTPL